MSEQSEALKERTMLFAVNTLRLVDRFPHTVGADASPQAQHSLGGVKEQVPGVVR